jgi:peptide/nickel transport system permease protein
LVGARPTFLAGFLGGLIIISLGLTAGLLAGYVGGWVEDVIMRTADFAYSIPLIPFAIVLVSLFGIGFLSSVFIIGAILWRTSARVLRSQVLQIKERKYVLAAKATGASTPRILGKHILPNVASMAILYFALGIGYTIIIQASLAFVGAADPFAPSWGVMIRNAHKSGLMAQAWWWALAPGIMVSLTVVATFMFGRGYESSVNQQDEVLMEG